MQYQILGEEGMSNQKEHKSQTLWNVFQFLISLSTYREYGYKWHEGGKILNKQNVFDDFQAAAEYLIENKYTKSDKVLINGGSNGNIDFWPIFW